MRIISLTAENVKRLVAVEIAPTGNVVEITGANESGKTSVLDCIWWALEGARAIQAQPIRKGEKKARIRLDLGELVVERRFTEKGSTLAVTNAAGAAYPSPQAMLDALVGALSFDPLAFARMLPRQQFDELRRVAKVDVDFDAIDAANKADFTARTELNRRAKALKAQAEAIAVPAGLPSSPVDERALLDRMQSASEENAKRDKRIAAREQVKRESQEREASAAALREEAADLHSKADAAEEKAASLEATAKEGFARLAAAPPLPAPIDVSAVRSELEAAKSTNAKIAERARRAQIEADRAQTEVEAESLTKRMAERDAGKAAALAAAQMPVAGLGLDAGAVTYEGVPFEQASSARQLRVSLAIAMAANPKLRVLRIKDGSLLDPRMLREISELAAAEDYQIWIERVDTSGTVGFVLEDGHARNAESAAAE